jgi:BirA family biotin operon repressor/biotin-[acetyl-CoA-carboxylase] ligase
MNIIKLNAIASTNSFLKELSGSQKVQNFTIVVADNQVQGRGQRGNTWVTESGKNLTFSMYVGDFDFNQYGFFLLNILVPIAIVEVLQKRHVPNVAIKWPNDILAENKKIAGILIENSFKSAHEISSVIGIGLNVNQLLFEDLPQASSLLALTGIVSDRDELLEQIGKQIKDKVESLGQFSKETLWNAYHDLLFRKDKPATFLDRNNQHFVGIIRKVTEEGLLQIELEDEVFVNFETKQVKLLY